MDENGGEFRRRQEIGVLFIFQITVHQLNLRSAPFHLEIFQRSNENPKLSLIQHDLWYRDLKKKFLQAPPFLISCHDLFWVFDQLKGMCGWCITFRDVPLPIYSRGSFLFLFSPHPEFCTKPRASLHCSKPLRGVLERLQWKQKGDEAVKPDSSPSKPDFCGPKQSGLFVWDV